jgi:hypothetical protein
MSNEVSRLWNTATARASSAAVEVRSARAGSYDGAEMHHAAETTTTTIKRRSENSFIVQILKPNIAQPERGVARSAATTCRAYTPTGPK